LEVVELGSRFAAKPPSSDHNESRQVIVMAEAEFTTVATSDGSESSRIADTPQSLSPQIQEGNALRHEVAARPSVS
jgi:hypothetical protein